MIEILCFLVVSLQNIYNFQWILAIVYKFKRIFKSFGKIFSPKKKILWSMLILYKHILFICVWETLQFLAREDFLLWNKGLDKAKMKIENCAMRMRLRLNKIEFTTFDFSQAVQEWFQIWFHNLNFYTFTWILFLK